MNRLWRLFVELASPKEKGTPPESEGVSAEDTFGTEVRSRPPAVREGDSSPSPRELRADQQGNRPAALRVRRDGQDTHEAHHSEAGSPESDSSSESRFRAGLSRNHLSNELERPWAEVPADVRKRAEKMTGVSLEQSYEEFTEKLATVIEGINFSDDHSRPARHRRRYR